MDIHLVQNVLSLVFVSILAFEDVLTEKISTIVMIAYLMCGTAFAMLIGSYNSLLLCVVPGIFLITVAFFTKEKIGYGDGFTLLGIGLTNGAWVALRVFIIGIGVSSAVSLLYIAMIRIKGLSGKKTMPFIPFMLMGLVVCICHG